jgi:hypothetical protein
MTDLVIFEVSTLWFVLFSMIFLPLLLGIWLFWSGKWRLPVLVSGTVYLGIILLGISGHLESYAPPEKRVITCSVVYQKSDLYCNGVYLGQTPFEISVKELVAKVPEWTSPPEQYYYADNSGNTVYTWLPWDDFRKEQYQEIKTMLTFGEQPRLSPAEQRKQRTKYETNCRYWWRLENNKSRIVIKEPNRSSYFYRKPFEKTSDYFIPIEFVESLSDGTHACALVRVLGELTESEKNTWDRHVLKHWPILNIPLSGVLNAEARKYRSKNSEDPRAKLFDTALYSTARLRYGLSDPPTEEECRQLLANWVDQSVEHLKPFAPRGGVSYTGEKLPSSAVSSDEGHYLIDAAIKVMGEAIRKPLLEQWKTNHYRNERGWAPLLYVAQTNHDADYFNEFVRYLATSRRGQLELLGNQNEQVIPLFKTFLNRKSLNERISEIMNKEKTHYSRIIGFYNSVDNPLLEPVFREYIVQALSDPELSSDSRRLLNSTVGQIIVRRINREHLDKNELRIWVESLPLQQSLKGLLVRMIRTKSGGTKSFSDFLEEAAGYKFAIETNMTADEVTRWFAENPKGTINEFCELFTENFVFSPMDNIFKQSLNQYIPEPATKISVVDIVGKTDLNRYLIRALLKTNTPETQKTIKQIFNNDPNGHNLVLESIQREHGVIQTNIEDVPSSYGSGFSVELPDFVFEILDKINDLEGRSWSYILFSCSSPKAGQLLEKWSHTENNKWKPIFLSHLEHWRKQSEIRNRDKQLFYDLVEDKILPDDLMVPPTSWVWKNGQYVPVDNHNDN